MSMKTATNACKAQLSRLSQSREVFVGHPADPLVDVVEVDQQELSVALQLLLVGLGLWLKTHGSHCIVTSCRLTVYMGIRDHQNTS